MRGRVVRPRTTVVEVSIKVSMENRVLDGAIANLSRLLFGGIQNFLGSLESRLPADHDPIAKIRQPLLIAQCAIFVIGTKFIFALPIKMQKILRLRTERRVDFKSPRTIERFQDFVGISTRGIRIVFLPKMESNAILF